MMLSPELRVFSGFNLLPRTFTLAIGKGSARAALGEASCLTLGPLVDQSSQRISAREYAGMQTAMYSAPASPGVE